MKQPTHPILSAVKKHPLAAELRLSLRRLGIVWELHCIQRQNRRAAKEMAYDRAHVFLRAQNFKALLNSNARRRRDCLQRLAALRESENDQCI